MARTVNTLFPGQSWEQRYRRYQHVLGTKYLVPLLRAWGVNPDGKKLLEVGSGNGGCGVAFHEAGASVTALEIDERLVAVSRECNAADGVGIEVHAGDIRDAGCPAFGNGPFDIVVMRDVIEHIDEPRATLANIRNNLSPEGVVFIIFPPYYSPYGAHQQILPKKKFLFIPYNKLPYLQLLPDRIFTRLTKDEDGATKEVRRLRSIRLTIRTFETVAADEELRVAHRKFFLSRPTFNIRYGLPVIGAGPIGLVPGLRELAVTAACYLLRRAG
jgi:SAM-dependent methyltransferase